MTCSQSVFDTFDSKVCAVFIISVLVFSTQSHNHEL